MIWPAVWLVGVVLGSEEPKAATVPEQLIETVEVRLEANEPDWKREGGAGRGGMYIRTWIPVKTADDPKRARESRVTVSVTQWPSREVASSKIAERRAGTSVPLPADVTPIGDESYRSCSRTHCTLVFRAGSLEVVVTGPMGAAERFSREITEGATEYREKSSGAEER